MSLLRSLLILACLLPAAPSLAARADIDGAWIATPDNSTNDANLRSRFTTWLAPSTATEVWLIEGETIKVYGPNLIFRITGYAPGRLTAEEDMAARFDGKAKPFQPANYTPQRVTATFDEPAGKARFVVDEGDVQRRYDAALPAGHLRAVARTNAAPPPAAPLPAPACPAAPLAESQAAQRQLQDQVAALQRRVAQCAAAVQPPPPPPTPRLQADADCPRPTGAARIIIDSPANTGRNPVRLTAPPDSAIVDLVIRVVSDPPPSRVTVGAAVAQPVPSGCGRYVASIRADQLRDPVRIEAIIAGRSLAIQLVR
jgi:hypothetical protein